jgi:putative peptide zinc metalloprotease protein
VGLFLVQVLIHESSHAVVAQVLKVPVRGLGVALLFFFMPLAYVDRTDAYRLRHRRGRALLALAGPLADGWVMGATGIVASVAHGTVASLAAALLVVQGLSLATNVNPLLPSDGYSAIEAATGLVDPRGRALALVRHAVRRQPLPSYLAHQSPAARRAYLTYGGACLAYIGVLAYFMLGNILHAVVMVRGGFGR